MTNFWLMFSIFLIFINGFINKAVAYVSIGLFSINEAFVILTSLFTWISVFHIKIKKIATVPLLFLFIILLKLPFYEGDLIDAIRNSAVFLYIIIFSNVIFLCRDLDTDTIAVSLHKCLLASSVIISVYYFFYPVRTLVSTITEIPGTGIGLLGNYASLYATSVAVIFYGILKGNIWVKVSCFLGILAVIIFAQSRASMLCVCLCTIMMFRTIFLSKDTPRLFMIIIITSCILILFGDKIGAVDGQRLSISIDNIFALFKSIFSDSNTSALEGTKGDRLMWWKESLLLVLLSPEVFLIGDNLATIIVDRDTGSGGLIRFPHNSFVTMLRIFGALATLLFILLVFRVVLKVVQAKYKSESPVVNGILDWYPAYVGSFFVASMFSTVIESPFHSMHFWLVSGLVFLLTVNSSRTARRIQV